MKDRALDAISLIKSEIERIKALHPVKDKHLDAAGAVYYANGNDGTDTDWKWNNRLCEFMVYYDTGYGYIKTLVFEGGEIMSYVYRRNKLFNAAPRATYQSQMDPALVKTLKDTLMKISDERGLWDSRIDDLDWDTEG